MTPSPLRDAMNDVMSSLDGMKMEHRGSPTKPQDFPDTENIWSPDDLNDFYSQPSREQRAQTSAGFTGDTHFHGQLDDDPSDDRPDPLREYVRKMEARLGQHRQDSDYSTTKSSQAPVPNKHSLPHVPDSSYSDARPVSSSGYNLSAAESFAPVANREDDSLGRLPSQKTLNHRKSAFELGRERMARTFTTKSNSTNASSTAHSSTTHNSNGTSSTGRSLMSGYSAGGFSATSAGSLAKRQFQRAGSFKRPKSSMSSYPSAEAASGVSYHSSHDTDAQASVEGSQELARASEQGGLLGGLAAPVTKKRGFLKKFMDQVQTSTASARTNMNERTDQRPRRKSLIGNGITSISGGVQSKTNSRDMGPGAGSGDWVQMRRDVNRSNSLSRNERGERVERCQMMDVPVMSPVDVLNETAEGDESIDGYPVSDPTDFQACKLALVDKSARFVTNLPAVINPISLAHGYLCRPYKSDVQRLRAIFTWVSERVSWEEDFEGDIDARRVIQTRRGCSEEIAVLVREMCMAVGYQTEVVRGYLKSPGEVFLTRDLNEAAARPNHWWNAVIADGEWRIMDCSLANPTNPKRGLYSAVGSQAAESWWFLARPLEVCYTHVPLLPEQQHIIPPMPHDVLMALPVACPPFFKYNMGMWDFDTSLLHLEGLEMAHVQLAVPDDVECVAEVECRAFAKDSDGDYFENGDVERKRALAQAEFVSVPGEAGAVPPFKRYTVKAVLPSRDNTALSGILKIYAGRRGLMHSINSNPHSLALGLALNHDGGENPPYDFFVRHPTPHALRHEIYVVGPLCRRVSMNNTYVFCVRQHAATPNSAAETGTTGAQTRPGSPNPNGRPGSTLSIQRPGSALSLASISASGSAYSNPASATSGSDAGSGVNGGRDGMSAAQQKPAKLAIQSPSGKILRMSRKAETHASGATVAVMGNGRGRGGAGAGAASDAEARRMGSSWETIIKIGERGVWRGLVLADRSARWCVFGEWEAV